MKLNVNISLGNYDHVGMTSNEHDTARECAKELINELTVIESYKVDGFIINNLLPIIYGRDDRKPSWLNRLISEERFVKHPLIEHFIRLLEEARKTDKAARDDILSSMIKFFKGKISVDELPEV